MSLRLGSFQWGLGRKGTGPARGKAPTWIQHTWRGWRRCTLASVVAISYQVPAAVELRALLCPPHRMDIVLYLH